MNWLNPRRPKKTRTPPKPVEFVSFNDCLKELDRRGELGDFMARWHAFEKSREATP